MPDFEENRFVRRHITFHGRVQKVGFRIELAQMAERLELTGWVKNAENGEVIAEVQGFESRIRFLLKFMNSSNASKSEKWIINPIPYGKMKQPLKFYKSTKS